MDPSYAAFLARKAPRAQAVGIEPGAMAPHLFDFQRHVVEFALRQGRSGVFLGTGLGKTEIELEWSRQAAEASNGRALILAPLAVTRQIERRATLRGYDGVRVVRSAADVREGISLCNYDLLDALDPAAFGAVALDESGILKSFSGATSRGLRSAFSGHRFKLSATATPAPNDHMELGQQSDFLSVMSSTEMLMRWFINDTSTASQQWRLKKHGEGAFWDWMASWSRCADSPTDLGFDGSRFVLPELKLIRHRVSGDVRAAAGSLFVEELSATNVHEVKRQTAEARAASIAELVSAEAEEPWVIWVDTDYEADAVAKLLTGAREVRGSHTVRQKEDTIEAFERRDFRILITKPSICGWGLDWPHVARTAFVGRSFSYEAWYQAVRRFWRFGQTRPVHVHLAVAEGEDQIGRVIDRKATDHERMKLAMAGAMKRAVGHAQSKVLYNPSHNGRLPKWLASAA